MTAGAGRLLVTGATGYLGAALVGRALAQGWRVRTLARREWDGNPAVPIEERYLGSFPDGIPEECVAGVDAIIHCAGTDSGTAVKVRRVNAGGTAALAALARKAGARAFIYVSSSSAAENAISAYGRAKYAAEKLLLESKGMARVIVRPNLIVGPDAGGVFGRMCRMVDRLPVLPLLNGGRMKVQPIPVSDLCDALLRCVHDAGSLDGRIMNLGHEAGVELRELLQEISRVRRGRRLATLTIPIAPVEVAVRAAGAIGLRLPVNVSNLQGLRNMRLVPTNEDMARLGLTSRPVTEALTISEKTAPDPDIQRRAVRVLVVGAGKMGLLHSLVVSRLHGAWLSGIADCKRGAARVLGAVGISAPWYAGMAEALEEGAANPDALVVATPPSTHLGIAREALRHGLPVLIEKPATVRPEQVGEYTKLLSENPAAVVQDGYALARLPHVRHWAQRIRAGELGRIKSFTGVSLMSLVLSRGQGGWQTDPDVSGGGVLANVGIHLLSMITELAGIPKEVSARSIALNSSRVEDSIAIRLLYPDFEGACYMSWSIPGYSRPEHSVAVYLDEGCLLMNPAVGAFLRNDGSAEVVHQIDFDCGYNFAPDFIGAGLSLELEAFLANVRAGSPATEEFVRSLELESLVHRIYAATKTGISGSLSDLASGRATAAACLRSGGEAGKDPTPDLALDCRGLPRGTLGPPLARGNYARFMMYARQFDEGRRAGIAEERIGVTAPDFMNLSRMLMSGDRIGLAGQMGLRGMLGAAVGGARAMAAGGNSIFWAGAHAMLSAELSLIPQGFKGSVLIHPYLVDLALSVRRPERIASMLETCRRRLGQARMGVHTGLARDALAAMREADLPADAVSVLSSPRARGMGEIVSGLRRAGPSSAAVHVTAEVGPAPAPLNVVARNEAAAWAHGSDSLLVGGAGDPVAAVVLRRELEAKWKEAFPGLVFPALDF